MAQTMNRPGAHATPVNPVRKPAAWPVEFYRSAVGKKWVMALSGVAMLGFVIAHAIGNLKLYMEPHDGVAAMDSYAEFLRRLLYPLAPEGVVLWLMRIGLLVAMIAHVHAAVTLTQMNRRARPTKYQSSRDYVAVNFASRSMRVTGFILLAYIVFHVLDLTIGTTNPDFVAHAVHANTVASLSRPWAAIVYIIANLAISVHLYHGIWSVFQSTGFNNPRYNVARRLVATGLAVIIGLVNILFPIMVLVGVIDYV